MSYLRIFAGSCLVAMTVALAAPASAQSPVDETTYVTFSSPFELPGVALPAGTYIFRLADPEHPHNVIQVLSSDQSRVYAMLMGAERTRTDASGKVIATFDNERSSAPPAIRTFFLPYDSVGVEFMYPMHQAERIAKSSHQPVLTADGTYVRR